MPKKTFPQIVSLPIIKNNRSDDTPQRSIGVDNILLESLSTSPYGRRQASEMKVSSAREMADKWTPISISSSSDDENDKINDNVNHQLKDFQLPVVMKKQPSMMSLRNRRDPQFHGIRTIRPARVVRKAGDRNVYARHLPQKSYRFFKDLVHTLVETQWRYVLMFFAFAFFGSWIFFGLIYWVIAWSNGDLDFDENGKRLIEGVPCIVEAKTFAGFFLFSVESQVSTGYGTWYPTEECPEAIFVLIVQLIIGLVIDAAVVGIFYVKIIRPPKYAEFKFSKKAVICQRDGKLCLLFRVADFNQSHSIDTKIRAYLFEERITTEGERVGKNQMRINLENNERVFLIWPQTLCHFIDKSSPFYDMSAKDLLERRFELVVSMTGISRHTGQMCQARTSYLSTEVLWGYRFTEIISYDYKHERYVTNIDKLDDIVQIDTALCSAQRHEELLREINDILDERDTMNSCSYVNQINEYEEESENDDDSDGGIHMAR